MAIPESIKQKANKIRNEVYGKDVREALASGIEEAGDIADQANTKSNDAVEQVDNIQAQVNQLVVEGDSSVEAAQARVDAEGKSYPTLKARLDAKETEFSSQLALKAEQSEVDSINLQLAQTEQKLAGVINVEEFPRLADETGDSARINRAIEFLGQNLKGTGTLVFDSKEYVIDSPIKFDTRGLHLVGKGFGTVLKAKEGYTGYIIESLYTERTFSPSLRDISIRHMQIDGGGTANGVALSGFNASCSFAYNRVVNCKIGLTISFSWGFEVVNNLMEYNEIGVLFGTGENEVGLPETNINTMTFKNNYIDFSSVVGIELNWVRSSVFERNAVEHSNIGILIKQENRTNSIVHNHFEFNPNGSIVVGVEGQVYPRQTTIKHNLFYEEEDISPVHLNRFRGLNLTKNSYYKSSFTPHEKPIKITFDDINGEYMRELTTDSNRDEIVNVNYLNNNTNIRIKHNDNNQTTSLLNGASGTIEYWIDNSGTCHVVGRGITCPNGTHFFRLPNGYAPNQQVLVVATNASGIFSPIRINGGSGNMHSLNEVLSNHSFYVAYKTTL